VEPKTTEQLGTRPPQRRTAAVQTVLQIESLRQIRGYMRGARAPQAEAVLALKGAAHWAMVAERAARLLEQLVPGCAATPTVQRGAQASGRISDDEASFLTRLLTILGALSIQIGLPSLGSPQASAVGARSAEGASRWRMTFPSYSPQAIGVALGWLVRFMNELSQAGDAAWSSERSRELDKLIDNLGLLAPPGKIARHFVRAAHERKIPWIALPAGVIQYGWGRRGRWLNSTFTDETPVIAARIARDKLAANALLRETGIPVPEQRLVTNVDAAVEAARSLGFPVVVKPADLDGGIGVSAGLMTEQDVRSAFNKAARHSKNVLIERHIEGKDYRIIVCHGRAVWATERVPAGVTGDGKHTVRELIDRVNRDPRRTKRRWGQMRPLTLDAEALELLNERGFDERSVPPAGQFVPLRRAANISSGGTPVVMTDAMHPDNAALAVRAARVLRLDIAGVDLIVPDISRSWRETGGALCEVNGQPQLSVTAPHIYGQLFDTLVEGQGRIPTALVLSTGSEEALVQQCTSLLRERKLCVGLSTPAGLFVGGTCVRCGRQSSFADVRALLIDSDVEAVVVVADGKEFLSTGLPFDRFDVLAVAGWEANGMSRVAAQQRLVSVLNLVGSHLTSSALVVRDHPQRPLIARQLGPSRIEIVSSSERLPVRLVQLLLSKHKAPGPRIEEPVAQAVRASQG